MYICFAYTYTLILLLIGYSGCSDKPTNTQGSNSNEDNFPKIVGLSLVDYSDSDEEDNFQVTETQEEQTEGIRETHEEHTQTHTEVLTETETHTEELDGTETEPVKDVETHTEPVKDVETQTDLEQPEPQKEHPRPIQPTRYYLIEPQFQYPGYHSIYYYPPYQTPTPYHPYGTQPTPQVEPQHYYSGYEYQPTQPYQPVPEYYPGPQYPVPIQQYPLPQPIQPQQQPTPQYYPEPYQQMPQPIPIPQPQQPTYQSPQGYQPQQPYYGPMLQPPPVTRYPLPPPQPAPQQPYYGPIPHPITQYAPPKHVQGYIRYPFIQQERILTHPSIISYPHVQFRLSGPKPQPKLPFPEPRGYFRPGNPIFARHNTKSYSQNKYISQSSSDQSDEQQTKEPTQAESSSHQPTQRPEETKEPTTQLSQEPTQHTQLTSEPSGLEPETIPVEVGSDEDEEHPQPPKEPGDGDQPPNKPEGADEGDEEGEGDDDEEEYEEDKKPSKVVKKCNKISLLKKNEEGELIEMIEGEDYKVIWKNLNKSKYEFIGNLEEILCDDELVYTNRPENGYPSLLTYNITLSVFVLRRQGGHVVVKCVDGKWIPEGRKIPGFMKMFIKDYFGNEIELVEGDYFLDLTACKSYKYTFAVGIACTRIEVRGETVWEKTDDDPFPISCCITFKMNLIVNFGQYKKIFAKRRGVFKLLIIKNK